MRRISAIVAVSLWMATVILGGDSGRQRRPPTVAGATVSTEDRSSRTQNEELPMSAEQLRASFSASNVEDTDIVRPTPSAPSAPDHSGVSGETRTSPPSDVIRSTSTLPTMSSTRSIKVVERRSKENVAVVASRTMRTLRVTPTLRRLNEEHMSLEDVLESHPDLAIIPHEVRSLFVTVSSDRERGDALSSMRMPVPSIVSMSTTPWPSASSSRVYVRSSNQKHERKQPGFQDIISGLVKLLGGKNVRVANNGHLSSMANLTIDGDGVLLMGSRINHRAPPKITLAEPSSPVSKWTQSFATTKTTDSFAKPSVASSRPAEIRPTSTLASTISTTSEKSNRVRPPTLQSRLPSTWSSDGPTPTTSYAPTSSRTQSLASRPDAVKTSNTGSVPSGPVTEWLPAHGVAIGFQLKNGYLTPSSTVSADSVRSSSTASKSSSSDSPAKGATKITTIRTTISSSPSSAVSTRTSTSTTTDRDHLPTEISYAEDTPPAQKTTSTSSSTWMATGERRRRPTEPYLHEGHNLPTTSTSDIVPTPTHHHQRPFEAGTVFTMSTKRQPEVGLVMEADPVDRPPAMVPVRSPTGSPFVIPVDIQKIRLGHGEVAGVVDHPEQQPTMAQRPVQEQSVFIDGRKTYFNLMPTETAVGSDSTLVNVGIGYTFPTGHDGGRAGHEGGNENGLAPSPGSVSNVRLNQPASSPDEQHRPAVAAEAESHPVRTRTDSKTPIRIDTCIIGDESACNGDLNETCRVEGGISSCYCRLGYGRDGLEQGCKPIVSLTVYIKVDRVNHEQISFSHEYQNPDSEKYQILEYEAKNAVESVFSLSALAETFVGSTINSFFSVGGRVIINATVQLLESTQTRSPTIKQEIRRGLIAVIQQQQHQNIGQSHLYVNGPLNPIPGVQDLDECADSRLNDCSKQATCKNSFGSFKCFCREGLLDKYADDQRRSGRVCAVCSAQHCNNRGDCVVTDGNKECKCHGNYIGSQCETDGEVLGVALGASLAALLIIVLTLVCLCMWSRRWKRDQQMLGHHTGTLNNHYSYFNKPSAQTANFRLPTDDRVVGWPPTSDQMDNFYAQPEPIPSGANMRGCYPPTTRPPSQPPPPPPLSSQQQQQQQQQQQSSMMMATQPSAPVQQPPPSGTSTAHRAVQHLRSLPLSLTSSRSNILDDTDEIEETDTSATKFYFPRPKSRANNAVNTNNIYYDVTFANGREQYACTYDKDYGNVSSSNAFPMKIIRPYHC